ncbi:unnamed protein product [Camellia sinensis]
MSILLEFVMERSLKKTINTFDRLTNLPDNIIHDILSLLRIRDIACVCTLSRRLGQLCFSVPSLNISIDRFLKTPIEQQKYNNFTAYMERFWQLRSNDREYLPRLCIANLHRDLNHVMDFHVVTWIYNATMCHVQELDLDIVLPNAEFNSLQDLSLKSFRIVDPLLGEWISSNCKAIASLSLGHSVEREALEIAIVKGEFEFLEIAGIVVTDVPTVKAKIDSFINFYCLNKARQTTFGGGLLK